MIYKNELHVRNVVAKTRRRCPFFSCSHILLFIFFQFSERDPFGFQTHFEFQTAVFIGRFQPVHNGHLAVIHQALRRCEKLIIIVGSANSEESLRNPFTVEERIQLLFDAIGDEKNEKNLAIEPVEDFPADSDWIEKIRAVVARRTNSNSMTNSDSNLNENRGIALIGHWKDASSYYLKSFPDWAQIEIKNFEQLNAADIRRMWLEARSEDEISKIKGLPAATIRFLQNEFNTDRYRRLKMQNCNTKDNITQV